MTALLVALAGGAGVLARHGLSTAVTGDAVVWVTLAINVAGSFALGLVAGSGLDDPARVALGAGFLGGFTTYSTFALQTWQYADGGDAARALLLVGASVVLGVAAAGVGLALARG